MADGDVGNEDGGVAAAVLPAEFGQLLRTLRLREGFSQQKLAIEVFESTRKSSIGELENDPKRYPHPRTLKKLSDVLNLTDQERLLLASAAERRRPANRPSSPITEPAVDLRESLGDPEPDPVSARQPDPLSTPRESFLPPQAAPEADPGDTPHLSQRKWAIRGVIAAVIVVLGVAAATNGSTENQQSSAPPNSPPSADAGSMTNPSAPVGTTEPMVRVSSLLDGQTIESPLMIKGEAHLPVGQQLWLIVHPLTDTTYYTTTDQSISIDQAGNWATRARLGRGPQDEGYKFDLFAVASPAGGTIDQEIAARPPEQYSAHFLDIPQDVTVLARLHLTLGRYTG